MSVEVAEEVARDHLPELVDRAVGGEVVVITRKGVPLVTLHPATHAASDSALEVDEQAARAAIRSMRAFARQHPVPNLTREEIKSWIEEGRP